MEKVRSKKTCSRCEKPVRTSRKQAYCLACHSEYMREWRKSHPLTDEQRKKMNCRKYTSVYVQRGLLEKKPCQICGNTNSEAHHLDYNQPLNVRWLCRKEHLQLHKFINQVTYQRAI